MDSKNVQSTTFAERVRDHRLLATFALLGTLSAGILTGSVLTGTVHGAQQAVDSHDATPLRVPSGESSTPNQFTTIAKQVGPAVVNINTEQFPKQSAAPRANRNRRRGGGGSGSGDPGDMQDFFNRFFGGQGPGGGDGGDDDDQGGGERRALGSGFIVDSRGYIITNNHVVDKADKIYVKLSTDSESDQGRPAHVIGTDKDTDLAVIKIDYNGTLPTVKLGNSDAEQVGDWVLAIGSPFSLSQTVTAGIVSAKNRTITDGPAPSQFQRFIQTDAAINPGNSGGPLLNMKGEVIGVNTAIYTSGMGSQGVGFAMPSNTVVDVYNQLISPEHKVVRGSIGIQFQAGLPSAVSRQYGFAKGGVLVSSVTPGLPAAKAGLQPQDVITTIDGKPVKDGDDLVANISARKPGSTVQIGYLRGTEQRTATVGITDRKNVEAAANNAGKDDGDDNGDQANGQSSNGKLGITIQAVPANVLQQQGLSGGVLVTGVTPGSFAEDLSPFGLSKGDIIVEINRKPVNNPEQFRNLVNGLKSGDDVVLVIRSPRNREKSNNFIGGTLP
ncbi:trypsin-like peptidase domain-containing protein [Terriglobus aquaticus]|uniref:Trypsin-like peptidase domain-containing protein n=1 Tax=Terriglobus aquaticus TaxID=940139 RepID=A0ABW9KJJ9_9BACT|nr:trypsin-like peptidase domain-containing protein [Terriglobus aquaticus]